MKVAAAWAGACALSIIPQIGCAFSKDAANLSAAGGDGGRTPDYDPERAFLTLEQIKPDPLPPQAGLADVPPLSAQGIRRLSRARELYNQQRFTQAVLELEKAFRHDPNHPRLHRELALAHRAAGNSERVRVHLRKAVSLVEDDVVTHYLLARLAFDDEQHEEAIKHYRVGLKASNASTLPVLVAKSHFHLAKALNAEGYLTAAIEEYRRYEATVADLPADRHPDPELESLLQINQGNAGLPISVAYEKLGRYTEAVDALSAVIGDGQPEAATRERFARLLARVGRFDEALVHARLLIEDGRRGVDLLVHVHKLAGHPEQVIDDLALLYQRTPERLELLMAYVDAMEQFGRLEEAERVLADAAATHPARSQVRWRLFDLYHKQGEWGEAVETAAAGIRADPQVYETARRKVLALANADEAVRALLGAPGASGVELDHATAYLLGSLAVSQGFSEQGERLLGSALEQRSDFVPPRVELAKMLIDRYAWHEAVELACRDSQEEAASGPLERLCGQAYAGLDDAEKAEEHLSAAIRLNRTDIEAMVALAEVYVEARQVRRARRQYEKIAEANQLHEASREMLVRIYLDNERPDAAAAQVAELARRFGSPHRIARCQALVDLYASRPHARDWSKYRQTLEAAISRHGPDSRTYFHIAESHVREGHFEEASAALDLALAHDPNDLDALEMRSSALQGLLEYQEAAGVMRDLLRRRPNRKRWRIALWRILMIDHQFSEAYAVGNEQLQRPDLSSKDRRDYRMVVLGALQRSKGRAERLAALDAWRQTEPDNVELIRWSIEAYGDDDRHDASIALAEGLLESNPQDRAARVTLLEALRRAQRYQRAQQVILDALEVDPEDGDLQGHLVNMLTESSRHDDALELLDNLAMGVGHHRALRIRSVRLSVLLDARRYDDVIGILTSWLREARTRPQGELESSIDDLRLRLAYVLIRADRLEEAGAKLLQWINEVSDDPGRKFGYLRAMWACQVQRGDEARALDALQRAYELNPRSIVVNNDLGYTLADAGLRIDQAERMIRFALAENPGNGAYIDSFGWVLYKKGEFERARRWLEKAADTEGGDDPVVHDHLGDVHWRLGRVEQAVGHWTKSVEMIRQTPEDDVRPDVRELIQQIQAKLDAQAEGRPPQVAPLAKSRGPSEHPHGDDS